MKTLLVILLLFFSKVTFSQCPSNVNYTVTQGGDGGYSFADNLSSPLLLPGDTLFIDSAGANTRTYVSFTNLRGSATCPIVIINRGFVDMPAGIELVNCAYVVISGKGVIGSTVTPYGMKFKQFWQDTITSVPIGQQDDYFIDNNNGGRYVNYANRGGGAITIYKGSHHIRVHNVEITKTKYGIVIKDDEECDTLLNYPNGYMHHFEIDSNYIHDTESQGGYVGTTQGYNSITLSRVINCGSGNIYVNPGRIGNLNVHDNRIENTGRGGWQMSVVEVGTSLIWNNTIRMTGRQKDDAQGGGITLGGRSRAKVFNNNISNTYSSGIIDLGTRSQFWNNTVDSSGYTIHARRDIDTLVTLGYATNFGKQSDRTESWFPGIPADSIYGDIWHNTFTQAAQIITAVGTKSFEIGGYPPSVSFWTNGTRHDSNTYNGVLINAGSNRIGNDPVIGITQSGKVISPAVNAERDYVSFYKVRDTDTTLYGEAIGLGGKTISSYAWTQTHGPNTATIVSPTSATTVVNGLANGYYQFKLTVTDNAGASDFDTKVVQVKNGNTLPVANAGADQNVTLPTSITLSGSATDADGTIVGYAWTRTSGPNTPTIVSPTSATTVVSGLTAGTYVFRLTATDDSAATAFDELSVIVNAAPPPGNHRYYKKFRIDTSKVFGTTHTSFPILIDTTDADLRTVANGGKVRNASGHDITFALDSQSITKLKWDVEKYSASSGKLIVWIKIDINKPVGNSFWMCYGDSTITTYQGDKNNTWASYNAVYHLADNVDATGRGNTITPTGTGAVDFIGDGKSFNGSSDFLNLGNTADVGIASNVTFSAWLNVTNYSDFRMLFAKTTGSQPHPYNWYIIATSGLPIGFRGTGSNNSNVTGTTAPTTGVKQYLTMTVSGNTVTHYLNGNTNGTGSFDGGILGVNGATDAFVGKRSDGYFFLGNMDEYRISSVARSSDWTKTEYTNQNAPIPFYIVGSEVDRGGAVYNPHVLIIRIKR